MRALSSRRFTGLTFFVENTRIGCDCEGSPALSDEWSGHGSEAARPRVHLDLGFRNKAIDHIRTTPGVIS